MHFQNNGAQQLASEATIFIVLEDVNDEIPLFTEREQETVMEGEPIGTPVTRWGEDFVSFQFLQFIFAHVDSKSEWKSNKILLTGSQLLHISSCAGMGISFWCKLYSNWWSMLYVLIFAIYLCLVNIMAQILDCLAMIMISLLSRPRPWDWQYEKCLYSVYFLSNLVLCLFQANIHFQ